MPTELGRLQQLQLILASDNQIQSLPTELAMLQNLLLLDVKNNNISVNLYLLIFLLMM